MSATERPEQQDVSVAVATTSAAGKVAGSLALGVGVIGGFIVGQKKNPQFARRRAQAIIELAREEQLY